MGFISTLVTKMCVAYLDSAGKEITDAVRRRKTATVCFNSVTLKSIESKIKHLAKAHTPAGYELDSYSFNVKDTADEYQVEAVIKYIQTPSHVIIAHMALLEAKNKAAEKLHVKWS